MPSLISFLCFLIFAAFVSLGNYKVSALGFIILCGVWISCRYVPSGRAWRMLKRMKIFFISILILYIWFTPGRLLIPALDHWSPSYEGLLYGSERIITLILLVLAVDSLLSLLSREKILSALYYFFYPLHIIGFDRERFIVRTLLTLEGASSDSRISSSSTKFKLKGFSEYMDVLSVEVQRRLNLSEIQSMPDEVIVNIEALPSWYHWILPFSLIVIFTGAYSW